MKAAVWHAAGDVRVDDVEDPGTPRPGNAVLEISVACICGSDVAEYRNGPHVIPTTRPHPLSGRIAPLVLGHEYAARILAVGDGVQGVGPGDRVCGDACLRCGTCFWCLRGEYNLCPVGGSVGLHADGAFARFLEVPAYTLFKVPESVPDRSAAIVEPLAVGLHALKRARIEAGEFVVVIGYGMIGAATAAVASAIGAGQVLVIERSASRVRLAEQLGAAAVLDPSTSDLRKEVRSRTEGRGADVVVDCTGNPEILTTALELTRRGGRLSIPGIGHGQASLSPERLVYFEREIIGSLGYRFDHPAVMELLSNQRLVVDGMIGDTVSLNRIVTDGFERVLKDPDAPLRIAVDPAA